MSEQILPEQPQFDPIAQEAVERVACMIIRAVQIRSGERPFSEQGEYTGEVQAVMARGIAQQRLIDRQRSGIIQTADGLKFKRKLFTEEVDGETVNTADFSRVDLRADFTQVKR